MTMATFTSANPHNVKVGQVWEDLDIRSTHAQFTVLEVLEDSAVIRRGPRHSNIRLDRFKKAGSRGYVLVKDAPEATNRFRYADASSVTVYGNTIQDAVNNLSEYPVELLARQSVNEKLNDFVRGWLSRHEDEEISKIYIGWYWRNVDFTGGIIPIGRTEEGSIGFMENNKWDYPSRYLTEKEAIIVSSIVWASFTGDREGGLLSDIYKKVDDLMSQLHPLLQSLTVE